MSLDLKVQLLGILLLFSFLKMEGQTRYAVVNFDSIDAFIEVAFFEENEDYLEIKQSAVSLFRETADFHILQHKTLGSSCGLEHPPQVRTEYLIYLENQIKATQSALSDILKNCENNAKLIVKKHLQNTLKELTQEHEITFISCTSDTYFQHKNTIDLTSLLKKKIKPKQNYFVSKNVF